MTDLTGDEAIDRDLLIGELEASRFADTELREDAWNPLEWVYLVGDGLFTLNAREFAPLAERLASIAGRLEGLPAVLEAARAALVGTPDRPVGRFQTETALRQLPGIDELIADALAAAEAAAPTDPAVAASPAPPDRAPPRWPRAAIDAFERHLREVVLPRATARAVSGPSCSRPRCATRCGPRRSPRSGSWPLPSASTAPSGPRWSGSPASCGRPGAATSRPRTTRAPSSAASSTRSRSSTRRPHDLLDFCRAENARIEAFCRGAGPHRADRRAARDPVDAGLPARVRWRDARLARTARQGPEGVLRDHPDARRLGRGATPSRTCARTTTGCSGC